MSNSPISVFLGLCMLVFTGCTDIPANVQPVTPFETVRYLGQWYEIARLDHSFERGLTHVQAHYSLRLDHKNYQYALVSGPNKSYLWLLSRTPTMDPNIHRELIAKAKSLGFDTSRLIIVDQSPALGSSP